MSGVLRRQETETRGYDTASVAVPPEVVGYRMTWMISATTKATTSAKSPRISSDSLCGSATRILRRRYGTASNPASNDLCFATLSPLQELLSSLLTFEFVTATGLLILTNSCSDSIGDQYVRVEDSVSGIDYVFKRTWRSRLHHSTCTDHASRAQVCLRSRNRLVIPITHRQINIPLLPVCRHSQSEVVRERVVSELIQLSCYRLPTTVLSVD
jgi:hypothetical protein